LKFFQNYTAKELLQSTRIGLTIVKIVDNHNGIITATGVLGEGATFLMLPA
jgi:light-regulated signal transduction histidine kinase (bacteriophytochrome)